MIEYNESSSASTIAQLWLDSFSNALEQGAREPLLNLFQDEAGWRDLAAFTWNLRQAHDRVAIADLILPLTQQISPSNFKLDESRPGPTASGGTDGAPTVIEAFFRFQVAAGSADGLVYLVGDVAEPGKFTASTLMTRLKDLDSAPAIWPPEARFDVEVTDKRWSEYRAEAAAFEGQDPEVLIVGGAQWGVQTAAHLGRLGVKTLIVEKQPKVGDVWRKRYEALLLHQPNNMLHYSMMPYPTSFPNYLPKEKVADWLEAYAAAFDLNVWTSTEFIGGAYDEGEKRWTVTVRRADGSERVLKPRHVMMATGGGDTANIPVMPGISDFSGDVLHANWFRDGRDYRGKNVLVVGTGTSAHDIALDIVKNGGTATMVQRSPLVVVNLATAEMMYGVYKDRSIPVELTDARFLAGGVFHQQLNAFIGYQQNVAAPTDRELHEGLQAAGMTTSHGEDNAGFYHHYLKGNKGGYYLNVGASDAIIRGDIKVMQSHELKSFEKDGIELSDGSHKAFSTVIFATSNHPLSKTLERMFGSEFVETLGQVWGYGTDGEMSNVNKPTAHEGFWILEGSLPMARWYSPLLALMVAAELRGVIPAEFKKSGHVSRTPERTVPVLRGYTRDTSNSLEIKQPVQVERAYESVSLDVS